MFERPDLRWVPTVDELRTASRWVWVLLVIGVLHVALTVVSYTSASGVFTAVLGAAPAVIAAALLLVAPRERLIRLAATGFALPLVLDLVRAVLVDGVGSLIAVSRDWDLLGPRAAEWTDAVRGFGWIFTLIGVLALAFYIGGSVRTRGGRAIIGVAIVLTALQVVMVFASWEPVLSMQLEADPLSAIQFAASLLGQLVVLAWGYLLAICLERRFSSLALAAAMPLVSIVISILAATVLYSFLAVTSSSPAVPLIVVLFWVVSLVHYAALLYGVLTELPRQRGAVAPGAISDPQEAYSAGR